MFRLDEDDETTVPEAKHTVLQHGRSPRFVEERLAGISRGRSKGFQFFSLILSRSKKRGHTVFHHHPALQGP